MWNDPQIADVNPQLAGQLPAQPIRVFYRSLSSGTTDVVTSFFQLACPLTWTLGAGLLPVEPWPSTQYFAVS